MKRGTKELNATLQVCYRELVGCSSPPLICKGVECSTADNERSDGEAEFKSYEQVDSSVNMELNLC